MSEDLNQRAWLPCDATPGRTLVADRTQPLGILVVDDEPTIAALLATMLSADGYEVDTAGNGVIALEKLREGAFSLILTDIAMPELDGPGFYRVLEEHHPHLCPRVIFLTGDMSSPKTVAFLEQTGTPVLHKPFRMEEVRYLIRQILGAEGRALP